MTVELFWLNSILASINSPVILGYISNLTNSDEVKSMPFFCSPDMLSDAFTKFEEPSLPVK